MMNTIIEGANSPFSIGFLSGAGITSVFGLILLILIPLVVLKGFALWFSAKRNEKWWFIALLIVNTLGLLELVYLIFVAKVVFNKRRD